MIERLRDYRGEDYDLIVRLYTTLNMLMSLNLMLLYGGVCDTDLQSDIDRRTRELDMKLRSEA